MGAETPQTSETKSTPKADSLLKIVGSVTTITIGVFYAVGLLVTNAYLLSIGVTDFNVFKARCLLTGTWAMPVLLVMAAPGVIYYRMLSREGSKIKKHQLLPIATLVAMSYPLFRVITGLVDVEMTTQVVAVYFVGTLGFLCVPAFSIFLNAIKERRDPESYWAGWFAIALFLVIITIDIGFFIYPSASGAFGGGKPLKAMLILNHEGVATWSKLPGNVDNAALAKKSGAVSSAPSEQVLTQEVDILYENDRQLVLRWNPKNSQAIVMLDRNLVSAVLPTEHPLSFWTQ